MDKLTMAHEWAMNSFDATFEDEEERAKLAWRYADAMFEEKKKRTPEVDMHEYLKEQEKAMNIVFGASSPEAEKREDKSRPDALAGYDLSDDIEKTNMNQKIKSILACNGVITISDLVCLSQIDIMKMPNIGRKFLNEIELFLARNNLSLKTNS